MNELKIFKNEELGLKARTMRNGDGSISVNAEDTAIGFGWTTVAKSGNEVVRWARMNEYCKELGFSSQVGKDDFIPESLFYMLGMKASNERALAYQKWLAMDVLPSIRKHGAYMTEQTLEEAILNPDTIIKIATALKEEKDKNKLLQITNSALTVDKQIMQPKAEYFDELVDRNLLTNFRETAKQLEIKEKAFVSFLLDKKYVYRDKRYKLMPYAQYVDSGLFSVKECFNDKTEWSGTQTLITPKGRETFRLLYLQSA